MIKILLNPNNIAIAIGIQDDTHCLARIISNIKYLNVHNQKRALQQVYCRLDTLQLSSRYQISGCVCIACSNSIISLLQVINRLDASWSSGCFIHQLDANLFFQRFFNNLQQFCEYQVPSSLKAAFHFCVFHTHVYARKTLNPSTLYIF